MYTLSYEEALERYHACETTLSSVGELSAEDLRAYVPMGIWEHFKSLPGDPKFYAVHGVGRDVDDGLYRVIYEALYGTHLRRIAFRQLVGTNPKTGALDGFLMPVDRAPYRGPRFRLRKEARDLRHLHALASEYSFLTSD